MYLCAHVPEMYSEMYLAVDFCYKQKNQSIVPKLQM